MRKLVGVLFAALVCGAFAGDLLAVCPAGPPTLSAPANNSTIPFGNVLLDWDAVTNATGYDVYIGLDGDTPSLHGSTVPTQKAISVEPGRTVQWKAVATAPACPAQASGYFFFTTTCPTNPANLLKPDRATRYATGEGITFIWSNVAGATSYDVEVTPDFGQTWDAIAENLNGLSFSTDDLPEGDWGWTVRANFDGDCDPLYAGASQFFVSNCVTAPPNAISPANDATNVANPVTFTWSSVAGADRYRLLVAVDGGAITPLVTVNGTSTTQTLQGSSIRWAVQALFPNSCPTMTSAESKFTIGSGGCPANPAKATLVSPAPGAVNLASPVTFSWNAVPRATSYRVVTIFGNDVASRDAGTATQLSVDLPAGSGTWAVQALFGENCATTLSDRRALTVAQGAPCANTVPPHLLSPQNNAGAVDSPALFQWTAVQGATGYTLFVSTRSSGEDFIAYGRTDAGTTKLEKFVPAGTVRWFVAAHFAACPDARSSVFTFGTAVACPAIATIPLVSPANGAEVTSPVTLAWTAVGAEYRVSIETESGATVIAQRTTNTSETFRLPVGTFYWRVDLLGNCPLSSERRRFVVKEGANCAANTAPSLLSPVGTATEPAQATSNVTLRWNPIANAIAYRVFIARDEQPFEDSTLTTATQKELELEAGRYRWFVNAIFEGCPSVPSAVAFFVIAREGCVTAAPTIISPQPNAVVQSAVSIHWTAVEGVRKYRVLALVNGDPFLLGTTAGTSLDRILPPGAYAIVVETELEDCPSRRSAVVNFTVSAAQNCSTAAPELLSPANGVVEREQEVDFTWTPVSGAIRYAVIAQIGEGAETTLGTTQDTHLLRNLPVGRITWRVVAFFAGCAPTQSPERTFIVERPANCTDRKPSLLFPRNGDEVTSPVRFEIVRVPNAIEHRIWVQRGNEPPSIVSTTPGERVELPDGEYQWFAEARFANCPSTFSARVTFLVIVEALPVCGTPRKPDALVIGQAVSGTQYRVRWEPLPNVTRYEVQESTSLDFANAQTFLVSDLSRAFRHEVSGAPVQYFYRVRGLSDCNDATGPFSDVVGVFIVEPRTTNGATELGEAGSVVQTIFLPGAGAPRPFVATADRPWLKVTPPNGTVPAEGLTLTVTADPTVLGAGTNTGTVQVLFSNATGAGGVTTNDNSSSTFAMSVSLVTPVLPSGRGTPPPDALIFAAVGHAAGVNGSFFESDIRVTNLTAQTMTYDLNFTPSGVNGTETGSTSTVEVAPGATLAMDDIVSTLFGEGTDGSALGMLEVRPVSASEPSGRGLFGSITTSGIRQLNTAASSRTYNFTPLGTFGQFIPATLFSDFVGRDSILSLQQVAESARFRANFGFLEASGNSAELMVRVYDILNTELATIPVSLQPLEHRQIGNMLRAVGLTDLTDGRVEVEVVGGDGKVTAYVSEIDNATNDPLLVSAVLKGGVRSDRYVVPGMAYLNTGSAFWVSDLRIFNGGTTATTGTMIWVPQGSPSSTVTREITLAPGEIEVLNNVVGDFFGQPAGSGGAIIITTPQESQLTVTARTYNQTATGTYGQYIVGVTPNESIGRDDRALQILQLEQSARIRSNIGVAETSGRGATVEISLITPDSLTTQVVTIGLAPNEFRQIGLVDFHPDVAVYNGRVTVKVIEGDGRVTAYGSAIDQITQDPTYVPAM